MDFANIISATPGIQSKILGLLPGFLNDVDEKIKDIIINTELKEGEESAAMMGFIDNDVLKFGICTLDKSDKVIRCIKPQVFKDFLIKLISNED